MKLIAEYNDNNLEVIEEKVNGKKTLVIEGVFMQADSKNRNGRVYPKEILENAVNKYVKDQVSTGRAVGELNHPEGPTINLDKVSHKITELKFDGSNVIGKASILETPMGQIVKGLLDGGVKLGVSSRGMGSLVQKNGAMYVKDDFMLSTAADIVADPSAPDAFVEGIMEGKDWVMDGGIVRERLVEKTYKQINTLVDQRALEENKLALFNKFLSSL